jgi:hypothetical protein
MTPEPTVQDETANNSDDSPADRIQGDHADQQECEHHQGSAPENRRLRECSGNDPRAGTLGGPISFPAFPGESAASVSNSR